ncbi:hypothetical protein BKE56_019250 [Rhodococcus sp. M8]|nr:hypothetical protein BKE56_019250 [Rhodococcus sp. M8]
MPRRRRAGRRRPDGTDGSFADGTTPFVAQHGTFVPEANATAGADAPRGGAAVSSSSGTDGVVLVRRGGVVLVRHGRCRRGPAR